MWVQDKLRKILKWIGDNKIAILVVAGWIGGIVLLLFNAYWSFYQALKFSASGVFHSLAEGPTLSQLDLLLLLSMSIVAGVVLPDILELTYGYIMSMFLSILTTTLCCFIYVWFVRGGIESWLAYVPFGWELVLFYAFTDVFLMVFPLGILSCLLGVITGGLLNQWFDIRSGIRGFLRC